MPHLAVALQFPDSDLANAEWGEQTDEELEVAEYLAGTRGGGGGGGGGAGGQSAARNRSPRDEHHDAPTDLATLRAEVATIVAGGRGAGPAWPIGVPELDVALGGGVPRGRVTEVVGTLGAGKTSLVRQLVARVLAEGGWVAWIDATRTLAPQELAGLGERLIVVRPHDHTRGAWCADLLLRSGVFALVVMDGAPVLSRVVGVRLSQLARERDAAFVVLREGTQGSRLGGAVRLQVKAQQMKTQIKLSARVIVQSRIQSMTQTALPTALPTALQTKVQALRSLTMSVMTTMSTNVNTNVNTNKNTNKNTTKNINAKTSVLAGQVCHTQPVVQKRSYSVLVEKGGLYRTVEVTCAIVVARRVCADTEIPDRRGVARRTRAAVGVEQGHDQTEQSIQSRESVRAQSGEPLGKQSAGSAGSAGEYTNIIRQHTIDAAHDDANSTVRRQRSNEPWKGRGRPRMAESGYGRSTRRGEARKLLHTRERERKDRQDIERNERHASKRESRRELRRYAERTNNGGSERASGAAPVSLGQLPTRPGGG